MGTSAGSLARGAAPETLLALSIAFDGRSHAHRPTKGVGIARRVVSGDDLGMPTSTPILATLTVDLARRDALDAVARATHRDRDAVLTEAIDAYLDVQRWQADHIAEGLRQAEVGEFASDEEIEAAFAGRL